MACNAPDNPQLDIRPSQARSPPNGIADLAASELTVLTSTLKGIIRGGRKAHPDTCQSPTSDGATRAPLSFDDSGDEGQFIETPMTEHNFDLLDKSEMYGHNAQRNVVIDNIGPLDTVHSENNTHLDLLRTDDHVVSESVKPHTHTHHQHASFQQVPKELSAPPTSRSLSTDDVAPIAIIGMSCRFPGDATSPERLWEMCANAREAWSEWPPDRFNQDAFLHPNPEKGGTFNPRGGHFLTQDMGEFDTTFFNITPTEAKALDPQQRIQLESAYEALENAGISLEQICGSTTGVYIGTSNHDYDHMLWKDPDNLPLYHAAGISASIMANRISYFFDLRGPSVTVDTACSSSLVALHQACQSLRLGESKTAIVGGANLILEPGMLIPMSSLNFFSPEGMCYTYDHRASGYGRGEGVGTVILKPLNDAIRDGDSIRCVIRSTGTNSDGRTAGLMLPNGLAQEALIRSTYAAAGLDPADTRYVESHGTGTKAGDPIESSAIGRVFGAASAQVGAPSVRVGSIKTNIGHLENASGIAGLIKTILSVERGFILPNSNFEKAGDRVLLQENNLKVPTQLEPWPVAGLRRASINSFGFGGTNAHCIIEDAKSYLKSKGLHGHALETDLPEYPQNTTGTSNVTKPACGPRLFVLSANDEHSIRSLVSSYAAYLGSLSPADETLYAERLAYTLYSRRSALPWREAIVASDLKELSEKLAPKEIKPSRPSNPDSPRLGFVFNGQGTQWPGMGHELMEAYQVYKDTIESADKQLRSLGAKWSLVDELSNHGDTSRISLAEISQPVCTAVQIALVRLFSSWGIKPVSVIGHSSGEIAAAYAAGIITLESAMSIAYYRGLAVANLKTAAPELCGSMLATSLSALEASNVIEMVKSGDLAIACINSPSSVTISGDEKAVDELAQLLEERKIFARKLKVGVAYHSSHMLYAANEYLAHLLKGPALPDADEKNTDVIFASSLAARLVEPHELGATYWVRNLVSKVQFSDALASMISGEQAGSINTLVEIGPHSTLAGPIKQILASLQLTKQMKYVPTLIRNEDACLSVLNSAQELWKQAYPVNVNKANRLEHPELRYGPLTDLPVYPFNHTAKHWHESRLSKEYRFRKEGRHDLLGAIVPESNTIEPRWRNILRVSDVPWLKDHIVQSTVVFPAAGYIAMGIEAKRQAIAMVKTSDYKTEAVRLRSVCLSSALVLPADDTGVEISISLHPLLESDKESSAVWSEFKIMSHTDAQGWIEHCRGNIAIDCNNPDANAQDDQLERHDTYWRERVKSDFADCTRDVPISDLDKSFETMGLLFGPTFRNLDQVTIGPRKNSKTIISIPDTASTMPYQKEFFNLIHPSLLDSFFQAAFPPIVHEGKLGDPMVPTFIEELTIDADIPRHVSAKLEAYALAKSSILRSYISDIVVFDAANTVVSRPVVIVKGLKTTSLAWGLNGLDVTRAARKICYTMPLGPDVDLIDNTQLFSLLPGPDPARMRDAADSLSILEWLAYQYLTEALLQIDDQGRENMAKHHRQFWEWAKSLTSSSTATALDSASLPTAYPILSLLDSPAKKEAAIKVAQSLGAEGEIVLRIGQNLAPILKGDLDPLALMLEGNLLTEVYTQDRSMLRCYELLQKYISLLSFKQPNLRILEIGAGTGGATQPLLESLGGGETGRYPLFSQYTYTDISSAFFEKARSRFAAWSGMVEYRTLDIEKNPVDQGFQEGSYDLIIAANVLHATCSMDSTLSNVRKLLKPDGRLVMIEITKPRLRICLPFGTLPGWWLGEGDNRESGPLLNPEQWKNVLERNGFDGLNVCEADYPGPYQMSSLIVSRSTENTVPALTAVRLYSSDISDPLLSGLSQQLDKSHIWQPESRTILSLGDLDSGPCVVLDVNGRNLLSKLNDGSFSAVKNLMSRADSVLWVTSGAQEKDPNAAMATGLARALRNENAGLNLVTLDLDPATARNSTAAAEVIIRVLNSRLRSLDSSKDREFIEKDGQIQVPRLVEYAELNELIARDLTGTQQSPKLEPFYQPGRVLQLRAATPGLLDSLQFADAPDSDSPLDADSVEFQVKAVGLNFRDVLTALGQIEKPYPLGYDSSGIVTAVGSNVSDFKVGDKVAALATGSFTNTHRVKAHYVFSLPSGLSFEHGASIPLAFATAYYALVDVARVSKGQKVLIHSAAGGVGQAAVKLAQLFEAEVFVTVGSDEKRQLMLDEYGIPPSHIFSSRNAGFAEKIKRLTDGQGVDIVLNSLSGELLKETWRCVAMFGYFLEVGKRDIYANSRLEMRPFDNHVTFSGIDLSAVFIHRPAWGARILRDCFKLFYEGKLTVMKPVTTFTIDQVQSAFRFMQAGKHSGKIVVTMPDDAMAMIAPRPDNNFLRPDATYIIAGGAGGLGREIGRWMVENGARHILLLSRSGPDVNPKVQQLTAGCSATGAIVKVLKCDTRCSEDVANVMRQAQEMGLPPIRGVVNGAMVLKDSFFENMTFEDWDLVTDTKLQSSWNLHQNLLHLPLDFFVLLSSASGISGNRGQSNYASSSTFQDAFARYRRSLGLPATTLDLGMIESAGYVAENKDSVAYLISHGYSMIKLPEFFTMLRHAILTGSKSSHEHCQIISGYDAAAAAAEHITANIGTDPKLSHFSQMYQLHEGRGAQGNDKVQKIALRQALLAAGDKDKQHAIMVQAVVERLASLLGKEPADVNESKSVASLGVDSLVAVELRNWIVGEAGVSLPIFEILAAKSLGELAEKVEGSCVFLNKESNEGAKDVKDE